MKYAVMAALGALVCFSAAQAQAPATDPPAAPSTPAPSAQVAAPPRPQIVVREDPGLDALISEHAPVELFAKDFGGTEGPIWLGDKLLVSDQRRGDWWILSMNGERTLLASSNGGPINPAYTFNQGANGAAPYKDGSILAARQGLREVGLYKNGQFTTFADRYDGKRFNSPNDIAVGKDGTVYFTDPSFSLPGGVGGPLQETPFMGVYRVMADGKVTLLDSDMKLPNGIVFSVDYKTLYVNDYAIAKIYAYDVAKDGSISNKREFATFQRGAQGSPIRGSTDGMKVDAKGNLWATIPGGVAILTPAGKELGRIQINGPATNVEFGGRDHKTLFITGGPTVYKVQVKVAGNKVMYGH